ncbi:MAG: Hsp70 family protein, partial [Methanoregula sp.]
VAASSGIRQFFVLDECSAVLLGMGVPLEADHPVLVVDCGGVSCTVTVCVRGDGTGTRLRVVGSAKGDSGGTGIDGWLASATGTCPLSGTGHGGMTRRDRVPEGAYERAKERLSIAADVEIPLASEGQYPAINTRITRATLEQVLTDRGFFVTLDRTIDRALAAAHMRGYTPEEIYTVVLAGGSGAIPSVLEAVRKKVPRCTVVCDRPAWAAARGAAIYRPGSTAADRIRNDYALRYWDPVTLLHGYRFLVRGGTPYPSAGQVARLVISAAYDGQTHLGIPLFEYRTGDGDAPCRSIELVGATGGGLQCADAVTTPSDQHPPLWVNEQEPMFLVADPPAQKGEPRFEVTFTIDGTRQLAVTARDMRTGRLIKEAEPLFRLT